MSGLYVAGDAASREDVAGGTSGGGAINSSWAIASGYWAGQGAANHARRRLGAAAFRQHSVPLGQAGLRPRHSSADVDPKVFADAVRAELAPLATNYFRDGQRLTQSLARLDSLWRDAVSQLGTAGPARLRHRETAAVLAAARFSLTGALARRESRGMHRRTDYPAEADGPVQRYALTGPDDIRIELTLEPLQEKAS